MGICTRRHFLLSICIIQLIATIIRQIFDFLGYMWIPILVNFFEIIFIIFGFFGTFQYQPKYVISYSVWNLVLLGWNLFLICLYLDVGALNHRNSKVLKLDPESASWWESNGPGCKVIYNTTELPKPTNITNCVFNYAHIEVFHATLHCLLALLGCITGICLGSTYLEKNDSFEFLDGDCRNPEHLELQPKYVNDVTPLTSHAPSRVASNRSYRKPSDSMFLFNPSSTGKSKQAYHVDRIRSCSATQVKMPRSKSYDRLTRNDYRNDVHNRTRPKSLYCNVLDA